MTQEKLAGLLAGLSGVSILIAAYFQQFQVTWDGGSIVVWWAKWIFFPAMILLQLVAMLLLVTS